MPYWTPKEQFLVFQLVMKHGRRWSIIERELNTIHSVQRKSSEIRHMWFRHRKQNEPSKKSMVRNRCRLCGQLRKGHFCTGRVNDQNELNVPLPEYTAAQITNILREKRHTVRSDASKLDSEFPELDFESYQKLISYSNQDELLYEDEL